MTARAPSQASTTPRVPARTDADGAGARPARGAQRDWRGVALAHAPRRLRPGNQVDVLRGGEEAYPAMLAAIAAATESVCLETYILYADAVGERFADALCERAAAGVATRLIYDAVGSFGIPEGFLARLREAGVEVLEYHPVLPWKARFRLIRRDHRKILVVDDEVAFTGGINLSDDYLPVEEGGNGWHDVHCRVRGPAVLDLARLFHRVWVREGGKMYKAPPRSGSRRGRLHPSARPVGTCLVRVLDNRLHRKRWLIRYAYLHAINRARRSISLMNAYFLPDRGVCKALTRAVARGVRVRVIVPEVSDVPAIVYAGRYLYRQLIQDGVEILCWPEVMMHAKIAVIDDHWFTIGSYNFDNLSLRYNLEVALEGVDTKIGAEMAGHFERDAAECRSMTITDIERRSFFDKLASWIFYQLRRWL
ncbi:MAG: phospholipase D-like domain-containing protein [Haliangiales bacterium]